MLCFVIQPFDGGDYDKRYKELFAPIILASGFQPYRVDEDSAASIPINEIEAQIERADACFADISSDNPNVWCEVGLAIAHKKELCLICSKERSKLPFDVQHRQVVFYQKSAPSDFIDLQNSISKRLEAIAHKLNNAAVLPAAIVWSEGNQSDLSNFEVAVIGALASELAMDAESISVYELRQAVDKQGYTALAANAGIRMLLKKQMIVSIVETDYNGNAMTSINLSNSGWSWIEKNMDKFRLKKEESFGRSSSRMTKLTDDEIPF